MQTKRCQTTYSSILDSSNSLSGLLPRPDRNMQLNEDFLQMGLISIHYLLYMINARWWSKSSNLAGLYRYNTKNLSVRVRYRNLQDKPIIFQQVTWAGYLSYNSLSNTLEIGFICSSQLLRWHSIWNNKKLMCMHRYILNSVIH